MENRELDFFISQMSAEDIQDGILFCGTNLYQRITKEVPAGEVAEKEMEIDKDGKVLKITVVTGVGYMIPPDKGMFMDRTYYELYLKQLKN